MVAPTIGSYTKADVCVNGSGQLSGGYATILDVKREPSLLQGKLICYGLFKLLGCPR
jgi:hypothetical protein